MLNERINALNALLPHNLIDNLFPIPIVETTLQCLLTTQVVKTLWINSWFEFEGFSLLLPFQVNH